MGDLAERRCTACDQHTPPLGPEGERSLQEQVPAWEIREGRLRRRFCFHDFRASIRFVDLLAETAEQEGHHPVFTVAIDKVDVVLWTHAIGALSENDFILAAKLDQAADRTRMHDRLTRL